MRMFSIHDHKAQAYNRPFFSATRATAMREVAVGLQNDQAMTVYATDFTLHEVGEFDPNTGRIVCEPEHPHHVCDIRELVELEEPSDETNTSPRIAQA